VVPRPEQNGTCGAEFWIADELWRMAHPATRENRIRFTRAVVNMLSISEKPRVFIRPRAAQARDATKE